MMDMDIQAQLFSGNINPQDFAMENNNIYAFNNQFSFNLQQKQEKPLLQYQQQSMQYYQHPQIIPSFQNHQGINNLSNDQQMMSQNLASLAERQRLEIDRLIILQNERLKWALQEQRKQQLQLILKKYESKIGVLLRQKDEEIAKAVNKTNELEEFLKRVENENQTWQKISKDNEEMVFSLTNTIEHLKESAYLSSNVVEDTESCCDDDGFKNRGNRAIVLSIMQGTTKEETTTISKKVVCKGCNIRGSCIIILPCSHLCLCQSCEAFLHSCPLCGTEKKATIQALI